jgi:hypothetical protein
MTCHTSERAGRKPAERLINTNVTSVSVRSAGVGFWACRKANSPDGRVSGDLGRNVRLGIKAILPRQRSDLQQVAVARDDFVQHRIYEEAEQQT